MKLILLLFTLIQFSHIGLSQVHFELDSMALIDHKLYQTDDTISVFNLKQKVTRSFFHLMPDRQNTRKDSNCQFLILQIRWELFQN